MTKVTLKRIDVFSVAKWISLTGFVSGFLTGFIYLGITFYNSRQYGNGDILTDHVKLLWHIGFAFVVMPIIYCLTLFVSVAIAALIYNFFSASSGKMKFEVELEESKESSPPPPPENWANKEI